MEQKSENDKSTMDVKQQLKDPQSAGSRGLANFAKYKLKSNNPIRQYIDIVDRHNKQK